MTQTDPFAEVDLGAFCCSGGCACICPEQERALRAYASRFPAPPEMTADQRKWCLAEIGSVEGWRREDNVADTDPVLARAVLDAWTDYCRDKGLL
jgi:hypothetical protein